MYSQSGDKNGVAVRRGSSVTNCVITIIIVTK